MDTQSNDLSQALFQHAGDAILLIDTATMRISAANPAAERLTGCSQAALLALDPARLLAPLPASGVSEYDGLLRGPDGYAIPVSVGVSTIDQAGTALMLIVRDMREPQRRSQREKLTSMVRLTASIAHEVNNPLQALHNTLHLLLSRPFPEEKRERLLTMAQVEVDRLAVLVQRMLELYRPSVDAMRPISIHSLLDSALAGTASTFQQHHVYVERDWVERLPWVIGIGGHLRQVFVDLAINAIEAMPDGGRLMVRTRLQDGPYEGSASQVLVEFADNGPGITDSEAQRIFEPFYSAKKAHAGLGLAISYSVVERHGGTLSVTSTGSGTTFRVALPVPVNIHTM